MWDLNGKAHDEFVNGIKAKYQARHAGRYYVDRAMLSDYSRNQTRRSKMQMVIDVIIFFVAGAALTLIVNTMNSL